eukprot:tig00020552_g10477.t1
MRPRPPVRPPAPPRPAPPASPGLGSAAGRPRAGECALRDAAAARAGRLKTDEERSGVYVVVTAIQALDGSPPPASTAFYNQTSRSCVVTWRCARCRLAAAANVSVDFRLVSRLAFAVAVNYVVKVPSYLTIQGRVTTHADGLFTVLRGQELATLPVTLTPLHFEDARDGSARYDASVRPADNRLAERNDESFSLCSLTLPLADAACAGEVVGFRAGFEVSSVYTQVSRVIKVRAPAPRFFIFRGIRSR